MQAQPEGHLTLKVYYHLELVIFMIHLFYLTRETLFNYFWLIVTIRQNKAMEIECYNYLFHRQSKFAPITNNSSY